MTHPGPARRRPLRRPSVPRVFRHRSYRLFAVGQVISLPGTWMQTVAQGWLVLELTDDPLALGVVGAAQFLPVMILGLFGGIAADAFPRRAGLVATQVASAILALALGILVVTDTVAVWQVLVLAFLLGCVNAFDMPIRQSFVLEMVGREDIASAIGLNSAIFNASRVIGPAIGGLAIATVGIAACFLLNAASYVAVIAGLLAIRAADLHVRPRAERPRSVRAVGAQLAEGLRHVRRSPVILLAVTTVGVVSVFGLNNQVLLPLAARDLLDGDATTYGFLGAAVGLGSLGASLAIATGRPPTVRRLLAGAGAIGVAVTAMAFSRVLPLSLILMAVVGWGLIAMAATTNTIIQLTVPDTLRGRVMSVYLTVFAGSSPIGALFAGTIAAAAGVAAAFLAGGLLACCAVAVALLVVRRSDRIGPASGAGAD